MRDKVVGILGGVGPWATLEMFRRFLEAVPAERDQDYPHLIIDCNSKIPDRQKSVLEGGQSSVPALQETARALERAGADFIVIGSNGTHCYYDQIQEAVRIPVLNMIEETAKILRTRYHELKRFGLLAATYTGASGLYQKYMKSAGQEVLVPKDELQEEVMKAIYKVKKGDFRESKRKLMGVSNHLVSKGAEAIICGCTEVSIVIKKGDLEVPVIDPMQIIVDKAVEIMQDSS